MAEDVLSVGSSTSVASLWLMPRISEFLLWNRDVDVRLVVSDNEVELLSSSPDILVGYSNGQWPAYKATRLFSDQIIPVCSPGFARENGDLYIDMLVELSLIQLDRVSPSWTTWEDWLSALSLPRGQLRGPVVSNYSVALQAAELGLGVALGWHKLIRPLMDDCKLVRMFDAFVKSPTDFFLARRQGRSLSSPGLDLYERLMR
jgi:DNA-binding transcriptional LysR family regulator